MKEKIKSLMRELSGRLSGGFRGSGKNSAVKVRERRSSLP